MIRTLLGGLGMLMYGMIQMEHLIKKSVKGSFQRMLQKYTTNKRTSWIVGIVMTGITQSSSLVSLLVVVFVGAGLFTIQSGIAMVVGANIGTTFSSLLIALVGFGKVSITAFALPLIGLGGLGTIFLPRQHRKRLAGMVVSLGLIFLGIDFLKDAVGGLSTGIDLVQYEGFGIVGFFLVGVVITTIIQSSHTVVILALTALYSGLLSPAMALGIVIGSNIGTTTTVLLASIGGSYTKRQVAWSHLGFNCILSFIGLFYRQPLYHVSERIVGSTQNITISVAIFNTLLNTITTLVVMPFLGQFMDHIQKLFPQKQNDNRLQTMGMTSMQIESGSISQTALGLIETDLHHVGDAIVKYSMLLFYIDSEDKHILDGIDNEHHKKLYTKIYEGLTHCDSLVQSIANQDLSKKQESYLSELEERIDTLFSLVEGAKALVQPIQYINDIQNKQVQQWMKSSRNRLIKALNTYEDDGSIPRKHYKKIPQLTFTQLNTKEINHYDVVRVSDFIERLFVQI